MTHSYSRLRFIVCLLLFCGFAPLARAQRPPSTMVYDSLGRPIRKNHELLVTFNPAVINRAAVSSRSGNEGPLSHFLKPATANAIQASLGIDLVTIYAVKIVARAIPADSSFVDNTGQVIIIDPLWTSFVLVLPPGTDDYDMAARLYNQSFSAVQGVGFNWAVTLHNGPGAAREVPFLKSSGTPTLLAYPQPAQGSLTFALPSPLPATAELTILTASGQVLRTEKHRVYEHGELTPLQVDLSALPAGQYFYRLVTPRNTYRGRFEKQ